MYESLKGAKNQLNHEQTASPPPNHTANWSQKKVMGVSRNANFANGMLENSDLKHPRKSIDFLISLLTQSAIVIILVLIPLIYTHALNVPEFNKTMLLIPPPPPPPPPAHVEHLVAKPNLSMFEKGKLVAPKAIPKHVEVVKEAQELPPGPPGISGGVPGGVAGGTLGGVLGGVLGPGTPPAPPPKPVTTRPVKVGGQIQAPRLVRKVQPQYPPLAMQTRTQGDVKLDCIIDPHGNVTQMKLVSGSPLLVRAALGAVEQWKYQPTLLNGTPVAVEMDVTVHFQLSS